MRAGPCHRGQNASSQPNAVGGEDQSEHRGRHRLQQGGVLQQGGALHAALHLALPRNSSSAVKSLVHAAPSLSETAR